MSNEMSERGRQRVMHAASQVNPKDAREAAILGGIVRCSIDTGHFNKQYVKHYVPQSLAWFESDRKSFGAEAVNMRAPSDDEIAAITKRFMHFYNPPDAALIAA